MPSIHRTSLALTASAVLVAALGACGSDSGSGHGSGSGSGSGHDTAASATAASSSRAGDITFAQGMIPHHAQAVEMADIALPHADVSADVKRLATAVKAAQDPEIKQMQGWLAEWSAPTTAPHGAHAGHGMMSAESMEQLEAAAGADFNRMWMEMMIEHHEGAITMSQDVLKTTQDAEVKALAEAIIKAQQAEIAEMKKLLA